MKLKPLLVLPLCCLCCLAGPARAQTETGFEPDAAETAAPGRSVVAPAEAFVGADGEVVVVGSPYVELYLYPGRGFPRTHAVEKYEQLRLFKRRNDWFKVETEDGKQGWVRQRDLHTVFSLDGYPLDFSTPTWSDNRYPRQLGLSIGEFGSSLAYTAYAGYRLTANITAELRYTQAFGDFSTTRLGSVALVHQAWPEWRVSPFFSLGVGMADVSTEAILVEAEDTSDTTLSTGGGFMVYFSHRLAARVEYYKHTLLTTRENNEEVEEWKAGFSVSF